MVKHIILWKLKAEYNTAEIKNNIKEKLEGLVGRVPGLLALEVQAEGLSSSNADVMLYSELEDEEALKSYAVNPEHNRVADEFVRPFTAERVCMDFKA